MSAIKGKGEMPTKQDARQKIAAAEEACTKIQAAWYVAHKALNDRPNTNGYGVYQDPLALRAKLELVRTKMDEALKAVTSIDWPTTKDYDLL